MVQTGRTTQKLTLEDIIEEEVKRRITTVPAASSPTSFLNISSLKDITELIREINKAAETFQKMKGYAPNPVRIPPPEITVENKEKVNPVTPTIDYEAVLDKVIGAFDVFIGVYGDIPLSKAKEIIVENKEEVLSLMKQGIGV